MRRCLVFLAIAVLTPAAIHPALALQLEHPSLPKLIRERTENATTNGEASVGLGIVVDKYDVSDPYYQYRDCLCLNLSMTSNSRVGVEYGQAIHLYQWISEDEIVERNDHSNLGDNAGFWCDFPVGFYFRFYGVVYTKTWVSTNGFICFDSSQSTRWTPTAIPSPKWPNALIAPAWTDFVVDSSSSVITGLYEGFTECFVVIWKNVRDSGSLTRCTFEVILEQIPSYAPTLNKDFQNHIRFSYCSLHNLNSNYVVGIEDQTGYKGVGELHAGPGNLDGTSQEYTCAGSSFFLETLTLEFDEVAGSSSQIDINEKRVCGYNLQTTTTTPNYEKDRSFVRALAGSATLLLGLPSLGGVEGGIMALSALLNPGMVVDYTLLGLDWVDYFNEAQTLNVTLLQIVDYDTGASRHAKATSPAYNYSVDATFSMLVKWILDDPSTQFHTLRVMAKLEYYEFNPTLGRISKTPIETVLSFDATPDNSDSFDTAQSIQPCTRSEWLYLDGGGDPADYYKVDVSSGQRLFARLSHVPWDWQWFGLRLYDPNGNLKATSERGVGYDQVVNVIANVSGFWYVKAYWMAGYGYYSLETSVGGVPLIPDELSGPAAGDQGDLYEYCLYPIDPDGGTVKAEVDWGDGTKSTCAYWYQSGTYVPMSHFWSQPALYHLKVRVQDVTGLWSTWSDDLLVNIKGIGGSGGHGFGGNPFMPPMPLGEGEFAG